MQYFELQCKSNFSFLEGASHAHEYAEQAQLLGYSGFAITDRNTLAGIVRAHTAARDLKLPFIVGSEVHPIDGPPVILWPQSRCGYANLCKLLSIGRLRATKGSCYISWHDIADHGNEMLVGVIPRLPDESVGNAKSGLGLPPASTWDTNAALNFRAARDQHAPRLYVVPRCGVL